MSEDKTPAATETVSESPATETAQDSSNEQYIAESKKYRKGAQDAEARLAKYEKAKSKAEEDRLKEKEEFKTLYEKASSDIEGLTANADKWSKYEEAKRSSLLENHPDEDRDSLSKLDLETLEYVTNKINDRKPNAHETLGHARKNMTKKPYSEMTAQEKKENWSSIIKQYKPNN